MKISLNNAKLITAALVITTLSGFFTMATFLTGCIDDTEKLPKVVAAFTFTVNEDTGTVQFFNISERATKYVWTFGDNTSSTEKEPVKTYPAGTYEVTLKASNNAGASNEVKATVVVVIKDKVSLPITFDNATVDYEVTTFNGASFAIVNNPSLSGTNNKTTKVGSITNSGTQFEGMFLNVAVPIDLATKKTIAMNIRSTKAVNVLLKLEEGTSGPVEVSASHGGTGWENLVFNFTSSAKYSRITLFVGGATATTGTFFVDDIEQKVTPVLFDDGLLTNGSFESGAAPWLAGVGTTPAPVVTTDGNTYYSVNITSPDPGQPFLVNLSQKLALTAGQSYKLTFDAWSDRSRTILAGIGRSGGDFANVNQSFNITNTRATYTVTFNNIGFGEADNRVLFDNNGQAGLVNIDNVSLFLDNGSSKPVISLNGNSVINLIEGDSFTDPGATANDDVDGNITANIVVSGDAVNNGIVGTYVIKYNVTDAAGNKATEVTRTVKVNAFDDGLLTNGSFQTGASPWLAGVGTTAAPVVTTSGNTYYSVNITSPDPGQPYLVNLSQKLSLTAGQSYKLTFDAWSDRSRTILAGIGRSGGDFANVNQSINLTTTRATYTATFTNIGFGEADNRVLFDNNGQAGLVNIDNVKLEVVTGGGGGSGSNLAANGDFETGTDSGWVRFQNGGTSVLDNTTPNNGTGSWSGKLATGGPSNPAFKQERIGAGTVKAGDVVRIKFDHKGALVQPGAVFNVLLFGEGASGVSFTHVFNPAPTLGSGWTTFTGTFTIAGGTDVSQGISFLIEAVCGGDAGCSVSANIDNVSVVLNP